MNTIENLAVGATSLMLSWVVFGRPLYNSYKYKIEAEKKYIEEFNRLVEEYE